MGNQPSKTPIKEVETVFNEKQEFNNDEFSQFSDLLKNLSIDQTKSDDDIGIGSLHSWESDFQSSAKNLLAQNAIAKNEIYSVIADSTLKARSNEQYHFNTQLKNIGEPSFLDNQRSSGRCWMFATSNILRQHVIKNYNLKFDEFQISQAYLFFYDKLERANFALDNLIETADLPLDSRLVNYILSDPISDGGQWDMIVNILEKYGAVPNYIFPDNAQASSSSTLNYILKEKIREFALILRKLKTKGAADFIIKTTKSAMMKEIYNVISISLGTPPKPTDSFTWEFKDKDGNYKSFNTTANDFYKTHINYPGTKFFSLIHDPRNASGKLYTVDKLNNMTGGRKIQYVNTSLDSIKATAIKMIKADEPVFFGCDVGKYYDRQSGILDTSQFSFKLGFGTDLNMTKSERLQTASSAMTHAMVLTGVHLDSEGKPVRWKIENSWGSDVGDKGYFLMTDEWFDEFVFQIVTSKAYASKSDYAVFAGQDYSVLPFYDPMGALAK
ncbi:cysteine proteinase 1, mitochondrial [[Candida] jaroonii]|uniref:Cysteine proteinase 1, mitochondrial n=1 Tax=[Candida] jaroonii TaxID=467808 RepID=A0ACA9YE86_9ASCO|nr:cysteine proteinase 1, mitochondrial [[Candida] jaroonii]